MKCSLCDATIPTGGSKCPSCGKWQVSNSTARRNRTRLRDVKTSFVERIVTEGIGVLAWNGGLPLGCVSLVGGEPGTGKSTLMLQVAARTNSCLYVAAEESDSDIRARAERIGVDVMDRVEVFNALGGAWINEALDSGPPCQLVILDSLPGMVGATNNAGAMDVLRKLKQHVVANRSHAIVIDHATKDDFFAGGLNLQHDVDTTLVMFAEGKDERALVAVKNRHGPSGVKEELVMTDLGLQPRPAEEDAKGRRK
jgi:DNA repair protein RadA/Sms